MADPQHVPVLDRFDIATVRLYRSGLVLASVALVASAVVHGLGHRELQPALWLAVTAGVALSVQNMHLYAKTIRWVIGAACWVGVVLQLGAGLLHGPAEIWVRTAGLGFVFVSLSGFALKEQFCFKVPFLRLVPLFLAASLVGPLAGQDALTAVLHGASGLVVGVLAVAKLRMPVHYDVGDKSAYQV